jgi:hypothetical protein
MMTNSNGKVARAYASCSPTWYWARSPVPVSPNTANRTELSAVGAITPPAPAVAGGALTVAGAGATGRALCVADACGPLCGGMAQAVTNAEMMANLVNPRALMIKSLF